MGIIMRKSTVRYFAPSISAASNIAFGMALICAIHSTILPPSVNKPINTNDSIAVSSLLKNAYLPTPIVSSI